MRVGRNLVAVILVLTPAAALAGDGSFGVPASGVLLPPPPPPLRLAPAPVRAAPPAPARTAALIPPDRAEPEKVITPRRVQQTYQPAPADGAGRSRATPPSEAPVHSPVIAPPKHKRFKAPTASVDPEYVESVAQGEPRSLSAPVPEPAPVVAQGAAPEQKRGLFHAFRNRNAQPRPAPVQAAQAPGAPMSLTPASYAAPAYAAPGHAAASAAYAEYNAAPVQRPAAIAAPTAPVPPAVAPVQPVAAAAPVQQAAAPAPAKSRLSSLFSFGGGGGSKAKPGARAHNGTPCSELRGLFTSPPECR